jgi:hypothetical protein
MMKQETSGARETRRSGDMMVVVPSRFATPELLERFAPESIVGNAAAGLAGGRTGWQSRSISNLCDGVII